LGNEQVVLGNYDSQTHRAVGPSILAALIVSFLIWALAGANPATAQVSPPRLLALTGPVAAADLAPSLDYFIDPDWQMTVSGLAAPTAPEWQRLEGSSVDFGYTPARIWLRVVVANRTERTDDWRVFVQANFWPTLQIWRVDADGALATLMDLHPDAPSVPGPSPTHRRLRLWRWNRARRQH
jgi:hypothetical protein